MNNIRDKLFEEFVKSELGDIAVFDEQYIGEKIPAYFKLWKEYGPCLAPDIIRVSQNKIKLDIFQKSQLND